MDTFPSFTSVWLLPLLLYYLLYTRIVVLPLSRAKNRRSVELY